VGEKDPQPAYSGFYSTVCTAGGGESEDRSGGVRSHQDIRRQDQAPQGQSNFLYFYFISSEPVLWIRRYFFRIRIRGAVILTYGSGAKRPVSYGSGSYLNIFVFNEIKYFVKNLTFF
jgi:hypothetical protein